MDRGLNLEDFMRIYGIEVYDERQVLIIDINKFYFWKWLMSLV